MSIRFAIIGCGRIAKRHAEHISKNGELVAVCDIEPARAEELATSYGAQAYSSAEAMLSAERENIDVVAVCSPNGLHADHSIQALRAGCHVLCEKPMALSVHDCGEMIKEAEKANRRLFIVKQNRYNPPVAAVKDLIDEGRLGKIYSIQLSCFWNRNPEYYSNSWKGTKDLDGGTLYTQFSHFIDLLYWMVGDVKSAQAFTGNFGHQGIIEFDDNGVVALQFYNGVIGTINYSVNSFGKNMEGSLTIFGEKGTVKIGGQYLNELEYQHIDGYEIKDLPAGNPANNYGQYFGSMSNHDKVYANVVDVLSNGGIIATNGFEGLKTVEIIDKIYTQAVKL
ncbi:Gfo/Idh/MocA family protein [Pontibacter cellulosilyticus]|uniref:Gfo/Idh/MocA family oxidoreductase n=1 Tax=Pontibacter cellulosilyticus TaxID=1720253 RepID=A0A923N370_9BACT|nr:Gfo/Idh/MocA family oxidoreductase [Pontibacter cellulosilyticus]MBC5991618.1 Gfo/Idh/MocA family oxidoreductase [Pontibacter cellulosilyticus]